MVFAVMDVQFPPFKVQSRSHVTALIVVAISFAPLGSSRSPNG